MLHSLDCAATNPNAEGECKASDMILPVGSGAACLVAQRARSRAGGPLCLGGKDGAIMNGSTAAVAKKKRMSSHLQQELELQRCPWVLNWLRH